MTALLSLSLQGTVVVIMLTEVKLVTVVTVSSESTESRLNTQGVGGCNEKHFTQNQPLSQILLWVGIS